MSGISSEAAKQVGFPENKKGFNGNELQDKEFTVSGLAWYDFNARTYDPQIGRFIEIDPISDEGEQENLSPYHFAENNPIKISDPSGKCGPCIFAIPAIVEGIVAGATAVAAYFTAKAAAPLLTQGVQKLSEVDLNVDFSNSNVSMTGIPSSMNQDITTIYTKGAANPTVKKSQEVGQEAHRQIQKEIKKKDPGAQTEKTITLKDGTVIRKDAIKSDGTPVIIKPDTKTGNASAKRRENLLIKNKEKKPDIILYDPKNPAYIPGSPTYIGPKK